MAAPHVAGAAALLVQSRPNILASKVRDVFQNSADPKAWGGNPASGFLDNVHRQGAGMVDIDDAITGTTFVTPAKLALGESAAGPSVQELTVKNTATTPVTYNLSFVNALSTGGTIAPTFWLSDATVAFSQPSITVPGRREASFTATITGATLPALGQYGGYIVLTPTDGGPVTRVPYAGFVGDYQTIPVLLPTANGFPWLAKLSGTTFTNQPNGATYSMVGDDVPQFLLHFEHQAQRFKMEVTQIKTDKNGVKSKGRSWWRFLDEEYFGRNSSPTGFFAFAWDGQTSSGTITHTVPDGEYVVTVSVLKPLGDKDDPAHTETWESPLITIDRP